MFRGNDEVGICEAILFLTGVVCAIILSLMIMITAVAILVKFTRWLDLFV